jgi:hypothetical protein
MKKKKNPIFKFGMILVIVVLGVFIVKSISSGSSKYDNFAQCIVDSGAKMYSAWWCPHCQEQKKLFGKSFDIIENAGLHVECSPGGTRSFSQFCRDAGITGTPTWKFADGTDAGGRLALNVLAERTNCQEALSLDNNK